METKKYRFHCGTGFPGADHEEEMELPATMTEVEVEAEFKEWVWDQLDAYWKEIE